MSRTFRTLSIVTSLAAVLATASNAAAQTPATAPAAKPFEFLLSSGSIVPTGEQRDAVKRANLNIAQFIYVAKPGLAVTSSIGWARTRDLAAPGTPKVNVFTYDIGAEVRARAVGAGRFSFRPFAAIGGGVRSYDYRAAEMDARHNGTGYVGVGGELRFRRVGLRVEARDYVAGFKPLTGGGSSALRNDVVFMAGLRFGVR